jgi:hypothetical protein
LNSSCAAAGAASNDALEAIASAAHAEAILLIMIAFLPLSPTLQPPWIASRFIITHGFRDDKRKSIFRVPPSHRVANRAIPLRELSANHLCAYRPEETLKKSIII